MLNIHSFYLFLKTYTPFKYNHPFFLKADICNTTVEIKFNSWKKEMNNILTQLMFSLLSNHLFFLHESTHKVKENPCTCFETVELKKIGNTVQKKNVFTVTRYRIMYVVNTHKVTTSDQGV